jgi:peptidoglycan/LPS O-acetylase OafA/YrhL
MSLIYRNEINGLRALAVIPILFFHAGYNLFSGGYVGVDIFFVISGYLITAIIINDIKEPKKFSFSQFYIRRARRLIPALFFVVLVSLIFAWLWMLPNEIIEYSKSVISVLFFVSNFFYWNDTGYFSINADFRPLLHTWSLAVEGQFYLIYPVILLTSIIFISRYTAIVLIFLFMLSLSLSIWASINKPTFAFFLLPTRLWEFLLGALTAIFIHKSNYLIFNINSRIRDLIGIFGVSLISYSIFFFNKNDIYPGYLALIPTIGTVLVITFSTRGTLIGNVLSTKPFVLLGLISYSVYLWHQPLFAFVRLRELDPLTPLVSASLIMLSLLFGYFTWRFIEPIWRVRNEVKSKKFFWLLFFLSISVFISFYLIIKYTNGHLLRLTHLPKNYFQTSWINYKFNDLNGNPCYTVDMKPCVLTSFSESKQNMLLVGDSHAGDLGTVFTQYLNNNKINGSMFSIIGCGYLSELKDSVSNKSCSRSKSLLFDLAKKNAFDTYLVISAGEVHSAKEAMEFKALIEHLLSSGAEVILFAPRMRLKYDPKKTGVLKLNDQNMIVTYSADTTSDWDFVLKELSHYNNFKIFDQPHVLVNLGCGEFSCFNGHTKSGHLIYRDVTHLTDLGAKSVMDSFDIWYKNQNKNIHDFMNHSLEQKTRN